jgi:hypothetical protein
MKHVDYNHNGDFAGDEIRLHKETLILTHEHDLFMGILSNFENPQLGL